MANSIPLPPIERAPRGFTIDKRKVVLALFIVAIATMFWSGSRYPELDEKALMGGDTMLEDPLSFEAFIELQAGDPLWKQVLVTTANWVNTNKKGMLFGLFLGAAFLSIIKLFKRRAYQSGFGNTLLGMVMGAPLGVCVNCAAPVARGIHFGGARLETTLAAMVSSPTLNVVVLTMVFSIFPIYLAVTKLVFTLVFILLVIPLLSRYVFKDEVAQTIENSVCELPELLNISPNEGWDTAATGAFVDYLRSLWFIVRSTVPLMLLAGFLGALLATVLPLESIATMASGAVALLGFAVVGLFLPVPMAFDVVIAAALLGAGMPIIYVMVLLFVLGIFSCYSAFIVATTISKRVSFTLFGVLAVMGILAGLTAHGYNQWELDRMVAGFNAGKGDMTSERSRVNIAGLFAGTVSSPGQSQAVRDSQDTQPAAAPATPPEPAEPVVKVTRDAFAPRVSLGPKPFTKVAAEKFGLKQPNLFSVADFWPPFYNGRGISSGDIDQDGWYDIVSATEAGVLVYMNRAGRTFEQVSIDIPELSGLNVFGAALVDLNNDGWLDLYLTTYRDGNLYILNDAGRFLRTGVLRAPQSDSVLTYSLAFGDIDKDGDLDAIMGNWYFGFAKQVPPANAQNRTLINTDGHFKARDLNGITGESLSVLLSDFNHDGSLDLVVGNDFVQPDIFYHGNGQGDFKEIVRADGIIPQSTRTTMSVDSADINNDLKLDLFVAQIAARATGKSARFKIRRHDTYCEDAAAGGATAVCKANIRARRFYRFAAAHQPADIAGCDRVSEQAESQDCRAMMLMKTAVRERDQSLCDNIPASHRAAYLCNNYFRPSITTTQAEYQRSIPQSKNQNVMLVQNADGRFTDKAPELGIDVAGWSWNAKLADLDNDEWQDIYVANGTWLRAGATPSNMFFHNEKGERFFVTRDGVWPGRLYGLLGIHLCGF